MNYHDLAEKLHNDPEKHHNCAQAVLVPFGQELGIDSERLFRMGQHFGGGMRRGATCGAVTGGLMALGLLGADMLTIKGFQRDFEEAAHGIDCKDLLSNAVRSGEPRLEHCNRMVLLATDMVAKIKEEQGL